MSNENGQTDIKISNGPGGCPIIGSWERDNGFIEPEHLMKALIGSARGQLQAFTK